MVANMETEEDGRRFYYSHSSKGKKTKVYCQYDSRKGLEDAIMDRRTSLVRAIEIYMEEVIGEKTDNVIFTLSPLSSTTNSFQRKWSQLKKTPHEINDYECHCQISILVIKV